MRIDVAKWRTAMLVNASVTNATKLLLVLLAEAMDTSGYVSVPRMQLAETLGVGVRRITERVQEAHELELLATVVKGKPGTTAVYVATMPTRAHVRTKRTVNSRADARTMSGGIQHHVVGLTPAPCETTAHAQGRAPVQPTSSTKPQQSNPDVPPVAAEGQTRSNDEKVSTPTATVIAAVDVDPRPVVLRRGPETCRSCAGLLGCTVDSLDANGRCQDCISIRARSAVAS